MEQDNNKQSALSDALRNELHLIRMEMTHTRELLEQRVSQLERSQEDQELRIRDAAEGVTQFRLWSAISNGSSAVLSLTALARTLMAG